MMSLRSDATVAAIVTALVVLFATIFLVSQLMGLSAGTDRDKSAGTNSSRKGGEGDRNKNRGVSFKEETRQKNEEDDA